MSHLFKIFLILFIFASSASADNATLSNFVHDLEIQNRDWVKTLPEFTNTHDIDFGNPTDDSTDDTLVFNYYPQHHPDTQVLVSIKASLFPNKVNPSLNRFILSSGASWKMQAASYYEDETVEFKFLVTTKSKTTFTVLYICDEDTDFKTANKYISEDLGFKQVVFPESILKLAQKSAPDMANNKKPTRGVASVKQKKSSVQSNKKKSP